MTTEAPVRVFICDDDAMARGYMESCLRTAPDVQVTGIFANADDAWDHLTDDCPDVVLTDVRMPGTTGIDLAQRIAGSEHDCKVLLITSFSDENTAAALRAGASGFILKNTSEKALLDAVRAVARGLTVVSADPLRQLFPHGVVPAAPNLTRDELDMLHMLCQGATNAEIAAATYTSESTVKRHVGTIMHKLGTTSRLTTVLEAQRWGID